MSKYKENYKNTLEPHKSTRTYLTNYLTVYTNIPSSWIKGQGNQMQLEDKNWCCGVSNGSVKTSTS